MPDALISRFNMVDSQVRTADVTDLRLIEAMRATPREAFLPDSQKALAYLDRDIALFLQVCQQVDDPRLRERYRRVVHVLLPY